MSVPLPSKRLMLLTSKLGYQTRSFAEAARRVGADVLLGTDRCHRLDDPWGDAAIPLDFDHPREAAEMIAWRALKTPVDGVLALGDHPTLTAAHAARRLDLAFHSVEAVENCQTKLRQREVLGRAGLPVPEFFAFRWDDPIKDAAARASFPCVLKPLVLAASQGVIRADNANEFCRAAKRIRELLRSPAMQASRHDGLDRLLVEGYIPGREVAVEGLISAGRLRVLAMFDKPDPLEGPYFEETIYVTPSRLHAGAQETIRHCAERSIAALGLTDGPIHAEFRWNESGPWVLEIQPRPIGGLCAKALRFGPARVGLEELLIRHALGLPGADWEREVEASGVMMIPVPTSGIFERVEGLDEALATAGITEIEITARRRDPVLAWPEGSSYLGFIFARKDEPEWVEGAIRAAHGKLKFIFSAELPVAHPRATA